MKQNLKKLFVSMALLFAFTTYSQTVHAQEVTEPTSVLVEESASAEIESVVESSNEAEVETPSEAVAEEVAPNEVEKTEAAENAPPVEVEAEQASEVLEEKPTVDEIKATYAASLNVDVDDLSVVEDTEKRSFSVFRSTPNGGTLTTGSGKIGTIYYAKGDVNRYWDDIYVLKINGNVVFCIEPMTQWTLGAYYNEENFPENITLDNHATYTPGVSAGPVEVTRETRLKIEKIVNFGYRSNPTPTNYAFTQAYSWESLGVRLLNEGFIAANRVAYDAFKADVDAKIAAYVNSPSWNNQSLDIKVGSSVTLQDTNGILSKLNIPAELNGLAFEKLSDTELKVTALNHAQNGQVVFQQAPKNATEPVSLLFKRPGAQTFGSFQFRDPVGGRLNFNILPNLGSILLNKLTSEGQVLPNTEFELLKDNVVVATQKTDDSGQLRFSDLLEGLYSIREKNNPYGYVLNTEVKAVNVTAGQEAMVEFVNQVQKGLIEIAKVSRKNGSTMINDKYSLAGAEFGVYKGNDLVGTIITDAAGKGRLENLALANYIIKELKAPNGFLKTDEVFEVNLTAENNKDAVFSKFITIANDEAFGRIKLVKKDHEIDTKLEGAKFNIVDVTGKVVDTVVTGKDGVAYSKELPFGAYRAIEVEAPTGYVLSNKVIDFTLTYKDQVTKLVEVARTVLNVEQPPKIGTTLTGLEGEKAVDPLQETILKDTVNVFGAIVGKWYDIIGHLRVVETGEKLMYQGKEVTASTRVLATQPDFTVELVFTFDARDLRGNNVVAFEDAYIDGRHVASEAKIDNPPQTVRIRNPRFKTKANINGEKTVIAGGKYTVMDLIMYEDFSPNKWYEFVGTIANPVTKQDLLINGKVPTGVAYVRPETENGEAVVEIVLEDTTGLSGTFVVLETGSRVLIDKDNPTEEELKDAKKEVIAEHKDYEDKEQQFTIIPPTPNKPQLPATGEANMTILVVIALGLVLMGAIVFFKREEA